MVYRDFRIHFLFRWSTYYHPPLESQNIDNIEFMSAKARCHKTLEYQIGYPDADLRKIALSLLGGQPGTSQSERNFSISGRQPGSTTSTKNLRTRMLIKTVQNSGLDKILEQCKSKQSSVNIKVQILKKKMVTIPLKKLKTKFRTDKNHL